MTNSRKVIQRFIASLLAVIVMAAVCVPLQASAAPYETISDYASGIFYQRLANVPLTGNYRTDLVNVALSQTGYCESDSEFQLSGVDKGQLSFTEYGRWYGYHNMWCAMFVSWCASVANISTDIIPKHAYTPNGLYFFLSNDQAHTQDKVLNGGYTPQPGDLVYFKSDRNENLVNHVGIVIGYTNGYLYTVEGNTDALADFTDGGAVMVRSRHISDPVIRYICCPNYPNDNLPAFAPLFPEDSVPEQPSHSEGTGKTPQSSVGLPPMSSISAGSTASELPHRVN